MRSSRLQVEVLPERGARHPDDGDTVLDAVRAHADSFDCDRTGLPEVIVDPVGREQAAEHHLDPGADLDVVHVTVGQLARETPATVEVEHGEDDGRALRVDETVDREGGDRRQGFGLGDRLHVVQSPPLIPTRCGGRWTMPVVRSREPDEAELPVGRAGRGRRRRAVGGRPVRGLHVDHVPPGQELPVGDRSRMGDLVGDRLGRGEGCDGVGRAEHEHVGTVSELHDRDGRSRARPCRGRLRARPRSVRPRCCRPSATGCRLRTWHPDDWTAAAHTPGRCCR